MWVKSVFCRNRFPRGRFTEKAKKVFKINKKYFSILAPILTPPSTCQWTISLEIKVQWGQLRYQSIENIHTSIQLIFLVQPFIFTGVASLQSEKMQKSGPKRSRQVGQHVSPDPKILLQDPIIGPCNLTKFQIDTTLLTPSKML